jgi:hypothetical protein
MTDIQFLAWAVLVGLLVGGLMIATAIRGLTERLGMVNVNVPEIRVRTEPPFQDSRK